MLRIIAVIITALAFAMPVQANTHTTRRQMPDQMKDHADIGHQAAFSPAERNLIRAHLFGQQSPGTQQDPGNLPPGLQKKMSRGGALPPGWQKKVVPGRTLDYQAYRHAEQLPDNLLRRLPPLPTGAEILRIDNKVVMLNAASHIILDAFDLTPTR